ncbi:MAG: J domain-containing protein [Candidatus Saccharibacteria bacterium]|nr:J domain-containing protein [Pseudorhodobacter sp.]
MGPWRDGADDGRLEGRTFCASPFAKRTFRVTKDPYATLGLTKTATEAQIRAAFKKLARKFHPDLRPDDEGAITRFKEISAANDLLKDPETRRRFDAGEIDALGAEVRRERPQQPFYRDFAEGSHAGQDGFADNATMEEFLARAFGGKSGPRQGQRARGEDVSYTLSVSFLDAANGVSQTITLPDGKTLQVAIPEGAEATQMLRLKGQGMPGYDGGPPGDAYVELQVEPHAFFHRRDDNIHVEVPVTLREAVLGGRIDVPTVTGPVAMTIPKGSNTGTVLRLRDRGLKNRKTGVRGHQVITLKVMLPTGAEPDLVAFLAGWTPQHPDTPRKDMLT